MKKNIIKGKSYQFAIEVVKVCKRLMTEKKEFVLSKQLLHSGTATGAIVREAEYAESKKDFIHKLSIALKEVNEAEYWIDLLAYTDYLNDQATKVLKLTLKEILKTLITIIKMSQANMHKK